MKEQEEKLLDMINARIEYHNKDVFDFMLVVKISIEVAEFYNNYFKCGRTGEEKRNHAKQLFPLIVNTLTMNNLIDQAKADKLLGKNKDSADKFQHVLDIIIDLTNNPNVIQTGKWIASEIRECIASCKGTKTKFESSGSKSKFRKARKVKKNLPDL